MDCRGFSSKAARSPAPGNLKLGPLPRSKLVVLDHSRCRGGSTSPGSFTIRDLERETEGGVEPGNQLEKAPNEPDSPGSGRVRSWPPNSRRRPGRRPVSRPRRVDRWYAFGAIEAKFLLMLNVFWEKELWLACGLIRPRERTQIPPGRRVASSPGDEPGWRGVWGDGGPGFRRERTQPRGGGYTWVHWLLGRLRIGRCVPGGTISERPFHEYG